MRDGFVKVAAVTPDIRVADVAYNTQNICKMIDETVAKGAKVIVFPELCVTGYTCSDLFTQDILLKESKEALFKIAEYTKEKDAIIFIGVPLAIDGELYNVAAALNHGEILGLTTKTFLPNYGEFYEMRQFRPGPDKARWITLDGKQIPFGPQLLFVADQMEELVISAEICEDVWSPVPPSTLAAREGATVIVNYCGSKDKAEAVVEEITAAGGTAKAYQGDVSDFDVAKEMITSVKKEFGSIDILVNNAGITKDNLIMKMSEEEFDKVIEVNLKGAFNCMKHVSRIMLKQRSGHIINMSSVSGVMGNAGQVNYCASKAGIIGMTKSLARELGSRGITVNAIAPGFIETEMTDVLSEDVKENLLGSIPLKRMGQTKDIAETVAFLASDKAAYITGQTISVDGGMGM